MTVPNGRGALLVVPDAEPSADVVEGWLFSALLELPQPLRSQAGVVALDLVASARMGGTAPFVVRLWVIDDGRTLAIAVDDCTSDHGMPAPVALLVAGLSDRWGVEERLGGRTLWAVLGSRHGSVSLRDPGQPPQWDRWFE